MIGIQSAFSLALIVENILSRINNASNFVIVFTIVLKQTSFYILVNPDSLEF